MLKVCKCPRRPHSSCKLVQELKMKNEETNVKHLRISPNIVICVWRPVSIESRDVILLMLFHCWKQWINTFYFSMLSICCSYLNVVNASILGLTLLTSKCGVLAPFNATVISFCIIKTLEYLLVSVVNIESYLLIIMISMFILWNIIWSYMEINEYRLFIVKWYMYLPRQHIPQVFPKTGGHVR